ncbi:hypothetical protein BX616_004354, partial [Lobosporangium transversale]
DSIASQIRGAVVVLNRLRRYAYWAIALDIERIMRLPGAAKSRKKALDEVLDSTDYSFRLATLLLSGQGGPNSAYARAKKQGKAVETPHYLLAYEHFKATTELSPIKEIDITLGDVQGFDPKKISFPRASELLMGQVQTSLRQHYRNAMGFSFEKSTSKKTDALPHHEIQTTEHGRKRRRECDESETNGCGSDVTAGPREPKRARRKAFQTYFTSVHMTRSRSRKLAAAKSQREAEEGKAVRVGKQPSEIATIGSLYQAKTTGSARADPATRAIMPTQRLQKVVENPVRNWH